MDWPITVSLLISALVAAWLVAGWLGRAASAPPAPSGPEPEKSDPTAYPGDGVALLRHSLGPYRLEKLLGKGSSGTIYRACHESTNEQVALKVIHPEMLQDFQRVLREIRNWQDFRHPNVVQFKSSGQQVYADGRVHYYMVMELVDGQTLRRKIPDGGLPPRRAWAWIEPLSQALADLHAVGIIHRDIKPENVMISSSGQLKLLDFGLAKRQVVTDALSLMDTYYGTPAYMDPDQLQVQLPGMAGGTPVTSRFDPRMDQYSLGVLIYELLTGRLPLAVHGWQDLVELTPEKHAKGLQPPSRWSKGLPTEVDDVVLKLLSRAPEGRYLTVREAASALRDAFENVQ